MQLVKGKLVPARDQRLQSLVGKQIREQVSLSHAATEVRNGCAEPWGQCGTVGSSPSLPPEGITANLLSPAQVAAVCLIPIT